MSELPVPSRKPRDDEMDVHGLTQAGSAGGASRDRYLMARIHKRIDVQETNLDTNEKLPVGEQRLAYLQMVADGSTGSVAAGADVADVLAYVHGSMAVYYGAKRGETSFTEQLQAAAMRAHAAVRARQNAPAHDATSLTLFIGVWPTYYLLQVGDTRCYIWNRDALTVVRREGMVTRTREADGTLAPAPRASAPHVRIVSEGAAGDATQPAVKLLESDWGNVHLLCSGELSRHVSDERIATVLATMTSAQQACEQLLAEALAAGATRDVTLTLSRVVPRETTGAP